jgi:peptidoglycan/LPS O-acetylase OafA/YrhL
MKNNISSLSEFKGIKNFNNLDGLRGLAIFAVIFHHVPESDYAFLDILQANGRYGVSLFFVISGFLISSLLLREKEKKGTIQLKKFYIRRGLRLYPLYYAVLILYCVLIFGLNQYSPENQQLFREKLPSYVFYYSNVLVTATIGPFFFAWSLAVEEQFYLVYAVLSKFIKENLIFMLCLFLLISKLVIIEILGYEITEHLSIRVALSYSEAILMGVILALFMQKPSSAFIYKLNHKAIFLSAGIILFALLTAVDITQKTSVTATAAYLLMTAMVMGAVLINPVTIIGGNFMSYIGKISYGIYLLHMLVINACKKITIFESNALALFVIASILTIIIAAACFHVYEKPILTYKQKFN